MNLPNIEKSAFRPGEYIGYSDGVWRIQKTNSTYGNWVARHQNNPLAETIWAHRLADLSVKLAAYKPAT